MPKPFNKLISYLSGKRKRINPIRTKAANSIDITAVARKNSEARERNSQHEEAITNENANCKGKTHDTQNLTVCKFIPANKKSHALNSSNYDADCEGKQNYNQTLQEVVTQKNANYKGKKHDTKNILVCRFVPANKLNSSNYSANCEGKRHDKHTLQGCSTIPAAEDSFISANQFSGQANSKKIQALNSSNYDADCEGKQHDNQTLQGCSTIPVDEDSVISTDLCSFHQFSGKANSEKSHALNSSNYNAKFEEKQHDNQTLQGCSTIPFDEYSIISTDICSFHQFSGQANSEQSHSLVSSNYNTDCEGEQNDNQSLNGCSMIPVDEDSVISTDLCSFLNLNAHDNYYEKKKEIDNFKPSVRVKFFSSIETLMEKLDNDFLQCGCVNNFFLQLNRAFT